MIAHMKILFATSKKFIAPSLLNHTSLLLHLSHQVTQDKVSNLLIFMIVSRLIAVELENKNEKTNQSTVPVLWLPIKIILKLTRLGLTVLCYRPCFADYGTGSSYQLHLELV